MQRTGIAEVRNLDVAKIGRSQFGRPNIDEGQPTWFELLPPLLDCDTKSHTDTIRTLEHIEAHLDPGNLVAQQVPTCIS